MSIREHVETQKDLTIYNVDLGKKGKGLLVLKNNFDRKINEMDPEVARKQFKKRISKSAEVLAFGFDYVLFSP
jgi:hypothetical protein